jgi:excisionase family DNA binding protein
MASLMRISEVADELGVSRATAYRLVANGRLPTVSLGPRGTRVPRASFEAVLTIWAEQAIESLSGPVAEEPPD